MSLKITFVCDICNDDEEIDHEDSKGFGIDLPWGWIEDPNDDDRHICDHCQDKATKVTLIGIGCMNCKNTFTDVTIYAFPFECPVCTATLMTEAERGK